MRMMQKDGGAFEVHEHIMTQNFWEFYILGEADENNVAFALVCGAAGWTTEIPWPRF